MNNEVDEEIIEEIIEEMPEKAEKSTNNNLLKEILSDSLYLLVVLVLTLLFVRYVGQRTIVIGSSMNPTLYDADNVIVDKISYRFHEPQRFDIIVFPFDLQKKTYYIKRIIGLPGETVMIDDNGNIYIDGMLLDEHYGNDVINNPGIAAMGITLKDDEYFVLGDNRNNSSDSRTPAVGNITRDEIIGRAWLVTYPFDRFGFIKHGDK